MSLLGNAKIIGGIGALLTLLTVVPSVGFILGIVGFIMVFVAVKYVSDETKDRSIFNNFLYFFIITIIAFVLAGGIFMITFLEAGGIAFINELQSMAVSDPMVVFETIQPLFTGFIAALLVLWITMIISAVFLRKSFDKIAEYTNVKWFSTTGLLFLVGAVTIIIFGIGLIIMLIALILEIIAFFSLPDNLPAKKA